MNMREYKDLVNVTLPESPPTALYPLGLVPEVTPPQLPRWRRLLGVWLVRSRLFRALGRRLLNNHRAFTSWKCSVWTARTHLRFKIHRVLAQDFDELDVRSFQIDGVEILRGGAPMPTSLGNPLASWPWESVPAGRHFRLELREPVHCWGIVLIGRVVRRDGA